MRLEGCCGVHAVCTSATDAMTASRCKAATNAGRMRRAVATILRAEVSDKDVLVLTEQIKVF